MVRRDGVRMENNDSMPDICRRGRDKINSPLSPGCSVKKLPAARHKYPKKMRFVKRRSSPDAKDRWGNVIFSHPVGSIPQRIYCLSDPFVFGEHSSSFPKSR